MTKPAALFDEAYYKHWYGDARTRAFTKSDKAVRAAFVLSYLKYLNIKVKSVCDLGCGLGHWREAVQAIDPRISYTGIEYGEALCQRLGWVQASAADYAPKRKFDLVVAQSSLHYLDEKDLKRAFRHIGSYCRGALYLEVITAEDWASGVIDKQHSDANVYKHKTALYRKLLAKDFVAVGGGVFIAKSAGTPLFALERAD